MRSKKNSRNANYPDSLEAATQKDQKTVMITLVRDRERKDIFFQLEADVRWSRRVESGSQSAQQLKTAAMSFDERKTFATTKEDLDQNTTAILVVI